MLTRKKIPRIRVDLEDLEKKHRLFNRIFTAAKEQGEITIRYKDFQVYEARRAYSALKNYQVRVRKRKLKEPEIYMLVEACNIFRSNGITNIVIKYDPDHKKRAFESVISIINASEQLKHIEVKPESERTHYDFLAELLETV